MIKATKDFGLFLGRSFLHALSGVALRAKLPAVEGEWKASILRDIHDDWRKASHPEEAFLNEFESSLQEWIGETITKANERMVIFIDDLDRCMPEVALQVLESLKLYLNIPDLIFVVGVDRDVINELVAARYKRKGLSSEKSRDYLAKMFQVEVTIEPSHRQIQQFFADQLDQLANDEDSEDFWQTSLSDEERNIFREVLLGLARQNPREVKRLLNSMLMHGAGTVYAADDGPDPKLSFAQAMQVFLVRKIVEERYGMRTEATTPLGNEFFVQWSLILCENPDAALTDEQSQQLAAWARRETAPQAGRKPEVKPGEDVADTHVSDMPLPEGHPYAPLFGDRRFGRFLKLIANPQLGLLMKIAYPAEIKDDEVTDATADEYSTLRTSNWTKGG